MGCCNTKILVSNYDGFGHKQSKEQNEKGEIEEFSDPAEIGRKREFRINGKLHCLNEFGKIRPVRAVKSCVFCSRLRYPPQTFSDIGACPVDTIKTGNISPSAPPPSVVIENIEPKPFVDPCPSSFIPPNIASPSVPHESDTATDNYTGKSSTVRVREFNRHRQCWETIIKPLGRKKSGRKVSNLRKKQEGQKYN